MNELPQIAFHSDAVASSQNDHLQFGRFVAPLASVIASPDTTTPLTAGIFGPWGSGKSSLLAQLEEKLTTAAPGRFLFIHFNPWPHRRESAMLVPLLHTIHDATTSKLEKAKASAARIFDVLTRLGANLLLKSITVNAVDLDQLDKLEKQYAENHRKVESELRTLRLTLEGWAEEVFASTPEGRRIVLIIDDLDRCEPAEIIDLLEAIKLFLDVRHVIVILAVDKEVIDRGLELRYGKFGFGESRSAALGAEYLEKIVQLPINLPPMGSSDIRNLLQAVGAEMIVPGQVENLSLWVPPNPRKIKRIVNLLAFTKAIVAANPELPPLRDDLLTRLAVLQVQERELFDQIALRPELLLALEIYRDDKANKKPDSNFSRFDANKDFFAQLCKKHFVPGGYLDRILSNAPFASLKPAEILRYLNLTLTVSPETAKDDKK